MSDRYRIDGSHLAQQSIAERRTLAIDDRLRYSFFCYMNSVLVRLGLLDGYVVAARHEGKIANVNFFGVCRRHGTRQRIRLPEESDRVLHERLNRLTRGCTIRFGSIIVDIADGCIDNADFIESVRPQEKAAPAILARLGIGSEMSINGRRFRS